MKQFGGVLTLFLTVGFALAALSGTALAQIYLYDYDYDESGFGTPNWDDFVSSSACNPGTGCGCSGVVTGDKDSGSYSPAGGSDILFGDRNEISNDINGFPDCGAGNQEYQVCAGTCSSCESGGTFSAYSDYDTLCSDVSMCGPWSGGCMGGGSGSDQCDLCVENINSNDKWDLDVRYWYDSTTYAFMEYDRTLYSSVSGVTCGGEITSDKTLTQDLSCSGDTDGIIIAASGITLDCSASEYDITGPGKGSPFQKFGIVFKSTVSGSTVKNCDISGFYGGAHMESGSSNNILDSNSLSNNGYYGIWIEQSSDNDIVNNREISNNDHYGIAIHGNLMASDNVISGNKYIKGNDNYAIYIEDSDGTNILDNYDSSSPDDSGFYQNEQYTILTTGSSGTIIYNNNFKDNYKLSFGNNNAGSAPITIHGGGSNTISSNKIQYNPDTASIYFGNSDYNTISDNDLHDNEWGIYLYDSEYNTFLREAPHSHNDDYFYLDSNSFNDNYFIDGGIYDSDVNVLSNSKYYRQWTMDVVIEGAGGIPVSGASVLMVSNDGSIFSGNTIADGTVPTQYITQYEMNTNNVRTERNIGFFIQVSATGYDPLTWNPTTPNQQVESIHAPLTLTLQAQSTCTGDGCNGVCPAECTLGIDYPSDLDCADDTSQHCTDICQNNDETYLDCGGNCGATCNIDDSCLGDGDCISGNCDATLHCAAASGPGGTAGAPGFDMGLIQIILVQIIFAALAGVVIIRGAKMY